MYKHVLSRRRQMGMYNVVIRWHFRRPGSLHELNYEFASQTYFAAHASSRSWEGTQTGLERATENEPRRIAARFTFFFLKYAASAAIWTGSKIVLCNFLFCCAFSFCQPMKKFGFSGRTELLVNATLRRVALGRTPPQSLGWSKSS